MWLLVAVLAVIFTASEGRGRPANAKPYDVRPSWATVSGPGLPENLVLFPEDMSHLGFWCGLSTLTRAIPDPRLSGDAWNTYNVVSYYPMEHGPSGFVFVFISAETYYMDALGRVMYARSEHDAPVTLRLSGAVSADGCAVRWFSPAPGMQQVLQKHLERHLNPSRWAKFACRWADSASVTVVPAKVQPVCQ